MTPTDRAQRIAEIVEAALECEPSHLSAFLAEACAGDALLRKEVESLLGYREEATDFIEAPAYESAAVDLAADEGELKPGALLGDYKIVRLLGVGGMGEVYLAEDLNLGREVAIKLVKAGFGRANLIRHFQREERILAALTHPNIARLYGGDVSENGVPYFVMEYVEGERLDSYSDLHQLTIPQRLELFRKVCAAVAYAHQHLVIHRDLKPSNIRVTPESEPKLLDFGIAKLLDDETALADQTITLTGVMTPDYASPEQIRGEAMTTASDVYSLGVVLYELLTGKKPYRTRSRRPDEISRAVTEQEPTKPSVALGRGQKSGVRSQKLLRGDLDNIVLTAMRKEPARRYSSVNQFSEDIRRHLEGRPVIARKDTFGYRAAKFAGRNRLAVAAAVLMLLAIVSALAVSLWQTDKAREQRDLAQQEKAKAELINTFLQDMLGAAAPEQKGKDVKVADVLSEASNRARTELTNQPGVMADVLITLGRTYISMGIFPPAEPDLRAALEASLKANGELHSTSASAMGWLGLALSYQGKFDEGAEISRKAVDLQRKLHPQGHEMLGVALYSLGFNLTNKGDAKSALPILQEAVDVIKKYLGEKHGYYLAALGAYGLARERSGDTAGAEATYRQVLAVGRGVEYRYRIFLAQVSGYLGILLTNKGDHEEAETILRQSESSYRELLGDASSSVAFVQTTLGTLYFAQGDYAKAESEYKRALELMTNFYSSEHPALVGTRAAYGLTLTRLGNLAEGERYLREVLEIRQKVLPVGDVMIAVTSSSLGECLTTQARYAEAEPLLTGAYGALKTKSGDQHPRTIETRQRLAKLYELWGLPEQAAKYRD